jgi:Tol biopolymer transport system component
MAPRTRALAPVALAAAAALLALPAWAGAAAKTRRASVSSAGASGNLTSADPGISVGGRYVVYVSSASNLVPGDTNGVADIFVRDMKTGKTRRVSIRSGGGQSDGASTLPSISGGGRYVAFQSDATNLVPGDSNGFTDVFVRDTKTGKTRRVSVRTGGGQSNEDSGTATISADGRFVVFGSRATNLVNGDTNGFDDIFVRDRKTGTTSRVNRSSAGGQANGPAHDPAISATGRYVVFDSGASNLVVGDGNAQDDVFVRDRKTHRTRRVSVSSAGVEGNNWSGYPSISASGRFVVFGGDASNLVAGDGNAVSDTFVRDRETGKTTRVSVSSAEAEGNFGSLSEPPSISNDGRFVAFESSASNLIGADGNGRRDVFIRDRLAGTTRRVSAGAGAESDGFSENPAISADGRFVAFDSDASNLVGDDGNGANDVFRRGPLR